MRGIYDKPRYSNLLQENAVPNPEEVAKAIARNYNWTIAPTGDAALNLLGYQHRFRQNGNMSVVDHIKNIISREHRSVSFTGQIV
jgi:hypothetical protein